MAIDNKTVQINTFGKGMNTDTSDSLLDNESYRMARNLRIVTDTEENSGELRLIEGATEIAFDQNGFSDHEVLATTQIRNYGLIITKSLKSDIIQTGTYDDVYDEDSAFYKYFITYDANQKFRYTGSSNADSYQFTVTFSTKYKISSLENDPGFDTSHSAVDGCFSVLHLPTQVTITYSLKDGSTQTGTHNLQNGSVYKVNTTSPVVAVNFVQVESSSSSRVVRYDTIRGNVNLKITLYDGTEADPASDDFDSIIQQHDVDTSSVTIGWGIHNKSTSSDPAKFDIYFVAALFSGAPNTNPTFDLENVLDATQAQVDYSFVFSKNHILRFYQGRFDSSTIVNTQILDESSSTALYNQQDERYPKDFQVLNSSTPGDKAQLQFDDRDRPYYIIGNGLTKYYVYNYGQISSLPQYKSPRQKLKEKSEDDEVVWNIWRFDNNTNELVKILTCLTPIGNMYSNKLSLVTEWEDDDNIKLYIADGEHSIMTVNVAAQLGVYGKVTKLVGKATVFLKPISNVQLISGQLLPAYVQYAYRLYNKHSVASAMSTLSEMQIVTSANRGIPQGELSTVGYRLHIPYTRKDFECIEIYRITYQQLGQLPSVELIFDTKFTIGQTYDDTGQPSLQNLTVEEFIGISGINIAPKVIESKDSYLFAGNIKYETSKYLEAIKNWDSSAMSEEMKRNLDLGQSFDFSAWKFGYDSKSSNITWGYVSSDFNLTPYNDGLSYDMTRSLRRGEIYRYGIVLYMDDGYVSQPKWIADIRTPELSTSVRQYLIHAASNVDDEELHNNGMCLQRLARYISNKYEQLSDSSSDLHLTGNNLGIRFKIKNLPEGCVGAEIVRCDRTIGDRSTITQVALSNVYRNSEKGVRSTDNNRTVMPTGLVTTDPIQYYAVDDQYLTYGNIDYDAYVDSSASPNQSDVASNYNAMQYVRNDLDESPYIYQAISPEIIYQPDDVYNVFDHYGKLYITPLFRISPQNIYADSETTNDSSYPDARLVSLRDPNNLDGSWYLFPYGLPSQGGQLLAVEYAGKITYDQGTYGTKFWSNSAIAYALANKYKLGYDSVEESDYRWFSEVNLTNIADRVLWTDAYGDTSYNFVSDANEYNTFEISGYTFPTVSKWNEFANEDGNFIFDNQRSVVNGYEYLNWVFPAYLLSYNPNSDTKDAYIKTKLKSEKTSIVRRTRINIGGRCAIITSDEKLVDPSSRDESVYHNPFSTHICNIKKVTTPYGGLGTRNDSVFYSHGNFMEVPSSFDTAEIDVYDGDTFIRCLEYSATHDWENPYYTKHVGETRIYHIPFETDINVPNDHGDRYSRVNSLYIQDQPSNVNGLYIQSKPEYDYNTAYNALSAIKSYAGDSSYYDTVENIYDYRVHYSNLKTNDEKIDSFNVFQPLNYLDVDTRYGEITDLRKFKNQLIYWQVNAVGILSVNERTQIADDSGLPLILGTGGVLTRYDYLNTNGGMRANEFTDTQSDSTLYWWDHDRHELCAYSGGQSVIPLSKLKNVQNYLNSQYKVDNLTDSPTLTFDKLYNEILFSVTYDGSLVYNEYIQQFNSVYDINHNGSFAFTDRVILLPANLELYQWNKSRDGETSRGIFGNELLPTIKYVVNANSTYTKVYDNSEFAGRFYGGDELDDLSFRFTTPLKQEGRLTGDKITNRQYDFEFAIPRAGKLLELTIPRHEQKYIRWVTSRYGDRLRGKTMQCEMSSTSNSLDFSLQYIMTKYRISWS